MLSVEVSELAELPAETYRKAGLLKTFYKNHFQGTCSGFRHQRTRGEAILFSFTNRLLRFAVANRSNDACF